jgi:hypothetical protein
LVYLTKHHYFSSRELATCGRPPVRHPKYRSRHGLAVNAVSTIFDGDNKIL